MRVHYCLRLIFLVIGTSLLTLTTSPVALSDGLEAAADSAEEAFTFPPTSLP